MQASQKSVMWSVGIVGTILLIAMLYGFSTINVPTASEIADEIDIEYPEFPEFPEYEALDDEKLDEVWRILFGGCILDLKAGIGYDLDGDLIFNDSEEDGIFYAEFLKEIDWDEVEEYLEDNLEDFDELEILNESGLNFLSSVLELDVSETKVSVDVVGECVFQDVIYNEDEDSEVTVTFEYDFKYEKDDSSKLYKDTLYITVVMEYDESEFEDMEITYSL